jgi:hypothetical protein
MLINGFLQVPQADDSQTESHTAVLLTNKRKPVEESESQEERPAKKAVTSSSSSKLMAFAFKKS